MSRRPVIMIAGSIVGAELVLLLTDTGPNLWLVAALVGLAGTSCWFATALNRTVVRPTPAPTAPTITTSHSDLHTSALRHALAPGHADTRHAERIRQQLIAIVDDELAAHGLDRHTHTSATQQLLGIELDRFVTDPDAARTLTPRSLARLVTRIEQI